MERVTIDFSFPNFVTVGLIGAAIYLVFVGGFSIVKNRSAGSA